MSAPELPPELAGHLDVLTDSSDAHAKARAATANASGNAHVAAVMGSALSRQLGDKAERSWDLAAFVKKHEAVAEFSKHWDEFSILSSSSHHKYGCLGHPVLVRSSSSGKK